MKLSQADFGFIVRNAPLVSIDLIVRNPDGKAGGLLAGFLCEGSLYELPGYNMPPDWPWTAAIEFADMNGDRLQDVVAPTAAPSTT